MAASRGDRKRTGSRFLRFVSKAVPGVSQTVQLRSCTQRFAAETEETEVHKATPPPRERRRRNAGQRHNRVSGTGASENLVTLR